MLTLGAIRTAVLSDQPWMRLDELVRAELSAGHTTRQIYRSLMDMADEIDTTPGLTEGGSNAFGDTLDALTGYCRDDQCYKDPPNGTLPSEEEIAQLPRWARVAFAARCARRVLPLYVPYWEGKIDYHRQDVSNAVDSAEESAARGDEFITGKAWAMEAANSTTNEISSFAAWAAADAIAAVRGSSVHVESAARAAKSLADLAPNIRRDFDYIASLAEWQKWDDDTSVPPEVFGPLWPEGPPKGWPPVMDVPRRTELAIEMFARERATEQMIEDDIVNLFNALNRYHIARSGVRLTLEQFRSLLPSLVPVGA